MFAYRFCQSDGARGGRGICPRGRPSRGDPPCVLRSENEALLGISPCTVLIGYKQEVVTDFLLEKSGQSPGQLTKRDNTTGGRASPVCPGPCSKGRCPAGT